MVLLDIDEYIWPEYDPGDASRRSATTSSPDKAQPPKPADDVVEVDEARRLYPVEEPSRAVLLPSHVPRFSIRTKAIGAGVLVLLVVTLSVGLSLSVGGTNNKAAGSPSGSEGAGAAPSSAAPFHATGSETTSTNSSSPGSGPHEGSTASSSNRGDDPCPSELEAAQACFVDDKNSESSAFVTASIAQSVCEACLDSLWRSDDVACGALRNNATLCQRMLECECGSCSGLVVAYLMCATTTTATNATAQPSSCRSTDDALGSIPPSCQQLLAVDDPSPSTLDLFPPEPSLEGDHSGSPNASTGTQSISPTSAPLSSSSPPPSTPEPKCENASRAFDSCVEDPDPTTNSASCLLCLLSYWPTTSTSSSNSGSGASSSREPECDYRLVNATCVGLEECDNYCHGCHDEYIDFLMCQVEACHNASSDQFLCP